MTYTLDEPTTDGPLSALLTFRLPNSELDHSADRYLVPDHEQRPQKTFQIQVEDLRPLLSSTESPREQLERLGYGVARHESKHLSDLTTKDGAEKYADETCNEVLREWLGCDRVITWNSVLRKNDPGVKVKANRTQEDIDAAPLETRPPLGCAHVDQSAESGPSLCSEFIGTPMEEFKRVMIVNLWRPLRGPITNAPLFVCAFPTINVAEDVSQNGHDWGSSYDVHHTEKQKWGYRRHQTPDEVYLLKNYDSDQGKNGAALFSAHVSGDVGRQDMLDDTEMLPRESVEVRCVALWD